MIHVTSLHARAFSREVNTRLLCNIGSRALLHRDNLQARYPLPATKASSAPAPVHVLCVLCCRVSWVLLPLLFLAVAFNYLDRTALAFASLQMNADLQLSTQQYGLAAATFALGTCRLNIN